MKKSELMFELEQIANSEMDSVFDIAEGLENAIRRYIAAQNTADTEFDNATTTKELNTAVDSIMRAYSTFRLQTYHNNDISTLQMVVDFTSSVSRRIDAHNQALLFEMM